MTKQEKDQIIALIQQEVVPATGCTEPVAVALAVAKAKETLGAVPKQIQLFLSANILKNAMGVGIPGTGMFGLPIAIALGALIGKSEYELNVLKDTTPEAVEQAKQYIQDQRIQIEQKKDTEEKLYIEVRVHNGDDNAKVIIAHEHTHFAWISKNGEVLLNQKTKTASTKNDNQVKLNLRKVYDFATTTPVMELSFILKAVELNSKAAELGLKKNSGHSLGNTILHQPKKKLCRLRRPYGRRTGDSNEQLGKWQPRHCRHHASGDLCQRKKKNQRRTGQSTDFKSFDSYIHQTKLRTSVSALWLCGGRHRFCLRTDLPYGRHLRANCFRSEKHDR